MNTQPAQAVLDFAQRDSDPEKFRLAAPTCHATGCNRAVVPGQHMCSVHLAMFSRATRDRILRR